MPKPQFTLLATVLAGGVALAGPIDKNVITPEPVCGPFYVSAYGGGSFFDDSTYGASNGNNVSARTSFDNGWIAGLAFGIRTDRQFRFEVDLNHTQSPADFGTANFFGTNLINGSVGGDVERTSVFLNAVKEFGTGRIHPYAGAGIGLTNVQGNYLTPGFFGSQVGEVDDVVLGYQFMGGVAYDLGSCLQTYLEYRLMGQGNTEDSTFLGTYGSTDFGWGQHVILGARWFF